MAWHGLGVVVGVAALCVACGGSNMGKPVAVFPSQAELENVAEEHAEVLPTLETIEVESWQLTSAVPAADAEYPMETSYDQILKDLVARQGGRVKLSPELACAARESARFYVEHGAYPTRGVESYLTARCGSTLPATSFGVLGGPADDALPEERVHGTLKAKFGDLAQQQLPRGLGEIGAGYARGKGRATVVVYSGLQRARLDGFSPLIAGSHAVLEGEVPKDAVFGIGLVNQGPNAVALCEPDRSVRAPRFRFACPVRESDATTRIELATRKSGQMLLTPALSLMVRRSEEAGLVYRPTLYGSAEPTADAATFQNGLLEGLNQARSSAGLPSLALETQQSKTNGRLAPHWFQAAYGGNEAQVELVALGLMAGWEVQGTIRSGGIYSGALATSRSPGRWLSQAMESPLARWVLLEPEAARVAIGANRFAKSGILALVTTYSFFESSDHAKDEDAVFEELSRARKARKLPPPTRARKPAALVAALNDISTNAATTEEAMTETVSTVSATEQRSVSGWILETSDLKQMSWSEEMFAPGPLEVSIGVTHYKADGAAWGQYAVLIVTRQNAGSATRTARLAPEASETKRGLF
jgi:hypothetical protein